jgi:hypothetical protein
MAGVKAEDFDVLLTDPNHEKLQTGDSEILGVSYLSNATETDAKRVVEVGEAILDGQTYRIIFPCVVT